jgi:cytochrome c biogenesis factor
MDPLGASALLLAGLGGGSALVPRLRRAAPLVLICGWWLAVARLAERFVSGDLRLVEVASYSRFEVPAPLRLAATWAGPSGSLLCWAAVVLTACTLALLQRRSVAGRAWAALGLASTAAAALVAVSGAFDRVEVPPLDGRGLNPVLEHPAMLVHPPLLYTLHGLVLFVAVCVLVDGDGWARTTVRRATVVALATAVVATLLGAWWAHDELGWGGWWAWDPVENTALAPLLALLGALHARRRRAADRWSVVAGVAVLAGVAVTRSGLPSSVHAFSADRPVSLAVAVVAVLVALCGWRRLRGPGPADGPVPRSSSVGRRPAALLAWAAGWGVVVIGAGEVAAVWLGTRETPATVDGGLLARLMVPSGAALLVGLVVWGFRRRHAWWVALAHAGVLVFLAGVVGGFWNSAHAGWVEEGEAARLGPHSVTVRRVVLGEDRPDLRSLAVELLVDGHELTPRVLHHPDLDRTRARPDRRFVGPTEIEVIASVVMDGAIRIEVRRHPGLGFVWAGGAAVLVGAMGAAVSRRGHPPPRRRRFASSSESIDAVGSSGSVGVRTGGDRRSERAPTG